jgi:hypothetical protein
MCEWFRMWRKGLYQALIVEEHKRPEGSIDVRKFFHYSGSLKFDSPDAALNYITSHITYRPELENKDFWKFADETLKEGWGDCEDGAILLANLLVASGFKDVYIAVFDKHVVVLHNWKVLDWTNPNATTPNLSTVWYLWNQKQAYTTKEHVSEWKQ